MSTTGDMMIEYEESNWEYLAEQFIQMHSTEWEAFVDEQFRQHIADIGDQHDNH